MFNIIGADGKQYGPVSSEQIRQWIREGRANRASQVQPVDSPDWKPLGEMTEFTDAFSVGAGAPPPTNYAAPANNKIAAGLCGILLGTWGVHKFILGYNNAGFTMLGISLALLVLAIVTCGLAAPLLAVVHIIGLVEGIIYLTKTDEEFVRTYVDGRKEWF